MVCNYYMNFLQKSFNGRRLQMLDHNDLTNMGIGKVGHQEIILDAVDLLLGLVNWSCTCLSLMQFAQNEFVPGPGVCDCYYQWDF